jgi:hypothetical protein
MTSSWRALAVATTQCLGGVGLGLAIRKGRELDVELVCHVPWSLCTCTCTHAFACATATATTTALRAPASGDVARDDAHLREPREERSSWDARHHGRECAADLVRERVAQQRGRRHGTHRQHNLGGASGSKAARRLQRSRLPVLTISVTTYSHWLRRAASEVLALLDHQLKDQRGRGELRKSCQSSLESDASGAGCAR